MIRINLFYFHFTFHLYVLFFLSFFTKNKKDNAKLNIIKMVIKIIYKLIINYHIHFFSFFSFIQIMNHLLIASPMTIRRPRRPRFDSRSHPRFADPVLRSYPLHALQVYKSNVIPQKKKEKSSTFIKKVGIQLMQRNFRNDITFLGADTSVHMTRGAIQWATDMRQPLAHVTNMRRLSPLASVPLRLVLLISFPQFPFSFL